MSEQNLTLRPYLEKIEKICATMKKKGLITLVLNMASEVDPAQRHEYLAALKKHLPNGDSAVGRVNSSTVEEVILQIEKLSKSIHERIESIEDCSYWDDPDEYEDEYYNDEEPDYISANHTIELAALFNEAGDLFMQHKQVEAGKLYAKLFSLVAEVQNIAFMPDLGVDMKEAHARYCRIVYEISPPAERLTEMATAMVIGEPQDDFDGLLEGELAFLQDVMDAQVGTLADLEEFLPGWEEKLAAMGHSPDRLASLRLESAFMLHGLPVVQKLAQSWQHKQPKGYLFWLEHLAEAKEWAVLAEAAEEALAALPMGADRRYAAGFLVDAGRQLSDDTLILQGRKEAFRSSKNETNILYLVADAERQNVLDKEIRWAIDILQKEGSDSYGYKSLLAKLFLMVGDLKSLAKLCEGEKPYGWSGDSPMALLFCATLYCAVKQQTNCQLIHAMLGNYACASLYFDSHPMSDEMPVANFLDEIKKGLEEVDTAREYFAELVSLAMQNGAKRVEHIVDNKHRGAYERAAYALGAMAENLVVNGQSQQAKELIHKYYFEKYNHFSAFRREVRAAVGTSCLLSPQW